jgi:tetratricopeptide (TPR) repeat protein
MQLIRSIHSFTIAALLLSAATAEGQTPADDSSAKESPPAAESGTDAQDQDDQATPPARSGGADPSDDAFRFGSPPQLPEGLTEEDMWPAATAEGWKRPVLVHWQRSFDDAMKVAQERQMPVMVCVNMDGEIASEHFAGVRYRSADTAARMSKYVCVIASVYRHTPRDYDETGARVPCPRFGTVTCSEHIEAERELYAKYFDGRRISPRHIVLDLEGKETFDVYFSWDTQTVFTAFEAGLEGWPEPTPPQERSLEGLTKSAAVADRERLEEIFRSGDVEVRRTILHTLAEEHVVDQTEVLRAAIFGLDLELSALARRALAQCETDGALDVMAEALKTPLPDSERAILLAAVERLAPTSKRARALLALHRGLPATSPLIDTARLELVAREYEQSVGARSSIGVIEDAADSAAANANDGEARLALAEALIARANAAPRDAFAELWTRDALSAAREAEVRGISGPRLDAVIAVASDSIGDRRTASERAIRAVEGGLLLSTGDELPAKSLDPATLNRVLRLFADARRRSIQRAYRNGDEWPPEWLSDVNGAYAILVEGNLEDESVLVEQYDFLSWIGATPRAHEVLEEALTRFPDSPVLHERLRARVLWEDGPQGLEREYAALLARAESQDSSTQLLWFSGYASLVAAEQWRHRSEFDEAQASYGRSIERFERSAVEFPDGRDSCDHYAALAEAGLARLALQANDLDRATDLLLASLARRPASAATQDGLGITPIMTAKMLKARLADSDTPERAEAVQAALDALDPELLEPPPMERPSTGGRGGRPQRGGR